MMYRPVLAMSRESTSEEHYINYHIIKHTKGTLSYLREGDISFAQSKATGGCLGDPVHSNGFGHSKAHHYSPGKVGVGGGGQISSLKRERVSYVPSGLKRR